MSLAKNAPSIGIGERLAAERLRLTGFKSSRENPQAKKVASDHKSDCAPVSAIVDTSAWVFAAPEGLVCLFWADLSIETVIGTLGWSRRRARFHSPLVKM